MGQTKFVIVLGIIFCVILYYYELDVKHSINISDEKKIKNAIGNVSFIDNILRIFYDIINRRTLAYVLF